ncbi:hypothetical protein LS684_13110 [Cytobacillus spongiae]|uniref:hypothetical protein n=1 Tax=Cytobacillus spongiae TaxID=2901381 RepID=UPI001F41277F|nr:hypothetical protein [Cytobacillus spongiae]UII54599.1 hypothetical protein LS684_13110 [Cytobacillus spongiae]
MNPSVVNKEELLSMLTEIHDQLEELESLLETNLTDARKDLLQSQSTYVTSCEVRLDEVEERVLFFENGISTSRNQSSQSRLKLELGY